MSSATAGPALGLAALRAAFDVRILDDQSGAWRPVLTDEDAVCLLSLDRTLHLLLSPRPLSPSSSPAGRDRTVTSPDALTAAVPPLPLPPRIPKSRSFASPEDNGSSSSPTPAQQQQSQQQGQHRHGRSHGHAHSHGHTRSHSSKGISAVKTRILALVSSPPESESQDDFEGDGVDREEESTPLPRGWELRLDLDGGAQGRVSRYYVNAELRLMQVARPRAPPAAQHSAAVTETQGSPRRWEEKVDRTSGMVYLVDSETGRMKWGDMDASTDVDTEVSRERTLEESGTATKEEQTAMLRETVSACFSPSDVDDTGSAATLDGFLCTYQADFTSLPREDVLTEVLKKFTTAGNDAAGGAVSGVDARKQQLRVCNAVLRWMALYPEDFQTSSMRELVSDFAETVRTRGLQLTELQILSRLDETQQQQLQAQQQLASSPQAQPLPSPVMSPRSPRPTSASAPAAPAAPGMEQDPLGIPNAILNVPPRYLAEVIMEADHELFRRIPKRALFLRVYKDERSSLAKQFNDLADWVASMVLLEGQGQSGIFYAKAKAIQFFVEVAAELRKANDFHGCLAVMSGLRLNQVHSLRRSWSCMEKSYRRLWRELLQLCDPGDGCFNNLVDALNRCTPPAVPHVGSFLLKVERISCQFEPPLKYREFASLLEDLTLYQQTPLKAPTPRNSQRLFAANYMKHFRRLILTERDRSRLLATIAEQERQP